MLNLHDLTEPATRRLVEELRAQRFAFDVRAPEARDDDPTTYLVAIYDRAGRKVGRGEDEDLDAAVLAAIADLERRGL